MAASVTFLPEQDARVAGWRRVARGLGRALGVVLVGAVVWSCGPAAAHAGHGGHAAHAAPSAHHASAHQEPSHHEPSHHESGAAAASRSATAARDAALLPGRSMAADPAAPCATHHGTGAAPGCGTDCCAACAPLMDAVARLTFDAAPPDVPVFSVPGRMRAPAAPPLPPPRG